MVHSFEDNCDNLCSCSIEIYVMTHHRTALAVLIEKYFSRLYLQH